ncbi:DUF2695 domain-containing protein [Hymenobacter jeollabukensis]|uniref:DUF2695 domain-containing protein n=1 Tax=Hymenobacter jeollabukensis TaxID=2025313 RepID=A0A5R8WQE4_9BACT|nr:DUF2695 domain-containing protein [Hymenobacter jeollabukensis]TLM92329.1 DUF2695 domain-containing protein [Hymenobacter jeollabukensis]
MLTVTDPARRPQPAPFLLQQRAALLTNLPLTTEQLAELFGYLAPRLAMQGCDHSLGHTRCFAAAQGLRFEPLRQFLGQHDGTCDCAVLARVEARYATIL